MNAINEELVLVIFNLAARVRDILIVAAAPHLVQAEHVGHEEEPGVDQPVDVRRGKSPAWSATSFTPGSSC